MLSTTTETIDAPIETPGERLRKLRKSRGLTLIQLSEMSGIDAAQLSRIETGERALNIRHASRLATPLGKSAVQILRLMNLLQ